MKKVCILMMIIIMSLTAVGCSKEQTLPLNSFYYEMKICSNEEISQTFAFPLMINNQKAQFVEKYQHELVAKVEEKVFNKIYLNYWLKYIENSFSSESKITFIKPQVIEDRVVFSVIFPNASIWKQYNNADSKKIEEKSWSFVEKIENVTANPLFEKNEQDICLAEYFYDVVKEVYEDNFLDEFIDYEDCFFEYRYVTPYSQIKTNADCKMYTSQGYIHSWWKNNDKEIDIWVNQINSGWWYLSALLGIFLIGGIVFIFYFIKKKKNND